MCVCVCVSLSPVQHMTLEAAAGASAADSKAAAGGSHEHRAKAGGAAAGGTATPRSAATAQATAAATAEVMDQLAALQQLVRSEAGRQQDTLDSTLKVGARAGCGCACPQQPRQHGPIAANSWRFCTRQHAAGAVRAGAGAPPCSAGVLAARHGGRQRPPHSAGGSAG
jgi:hypothetical protein